MTLVVDSKQPLKGSQSRSRYISGYSLDWKPPVPHKLIHYRDRSNIVIGEEIDCQGYLLPKIREAFGKENWCVDGILFSLKHACRRWRYLAILVGGFSIAFAFGPLSSMPLAMSFHWIGNFPFQIAFLI